MSKAGSMALARVSASSARGSVPRGSLTRRLCQLLHIIPWSMPVSCPGTVTPGWMDPATGFAILE